MTILIEDLAPDVLAFCERHGLLDAMRRSLKLVQEHFPDARQVSTELVHDPDARDKWVALNVDVLAGLPELMARDDVFLDRWIKEVDPQEAGKLVVMIYPAGEDSSA